MLLDETLALECGVAFTVSNARRADSKSLIALVEVDTRIAGVAFEILGEDPGPHLPLPHGALALGGELRGAHPE